VRHFEKDPHHIAHRIVEKEAYALHPEEFQRELRRRRKSIQSLGILEGASAEEE
jgi:hypothetical protein